MTVVPTTERRLREPVLKKHSVKRLQKTVEKPTFLEEAHLAFDQGSNLVSDMNVVLT